HGHLFIDRDSTIFPLILNYLRDGNIPLPRDEYYLERILREARFYKLHGLCCDIEKKIEFGAKQKTREAPKTPHGDTQGPSQILVVPSQMQGKGPIPSLASKIIEISPDIFKNAGPIHKYILTIPTCSAVVEGLPGRISEERTRTPSKFDEAFPSPPHSFTDKSLADSEVAEGALLYVS
ncbi:K+ channel tetramerization domain protein, partial [Ostertagia ostertagi]